MVLSMHLSVLARALINNYACVMEVLDEMALQTCQPVRDNIKFLNFSLLEFSFLQVNYLNYYCRLLHYMVLYLMCGLLAYQWLHIWKGEKSWA